MNKLLLSIFFFFLIASVYSMKVEINRQAEPNLKDIPLCLICSFAVDKIEGYLVNHANNTVIIDNVEHDCDLLKESKWVSKCVSIVGQYGPEIIQLLESKESPEVVCKTIHLC